MKSCTRELPAVFSAQKGLNDPRYPSLKGIMAAKSKPIEEKPAAAAEVRVHTVALRKPPAKNPGRIVGNRCVSGTRARPPPPRRGKSHLTVINDNRQP